MFYCETAGWTESRTNFPTGTMTCIISFRAVSYHFAILLLSFQAAITRDFQTLRERAEKEGLFQAQPLFFCLHLGHIVLLEVLAWLIIYLWGTSWTLTLLCAVMLTTSQVIWTSFGLNKISIKFCFERFPKAAFSSPSLVAGRMAAAWLWPPVCLQEVQVESPGAQVCHRSSEGNWYSQFFCLFVFSENSTQILKKNDFLREPLPAGGIIGISSITLNPTSSVRTLMSTCWTSL